MRSGMGRCGAFDLVLIQRLRVIIDVGQPGLGAHRGSGEGRRCGRTTKSTTANSGMVAEAPGVDEIDGALLLQRRSAPAQFRRCATRLAPATGWNDQ